MSEFIVRAEESDLFFLFNDFEELTRCKNCVYYGIAQISNTAVITNFCSLVKDCRAEEDYCSRAKKK